MDNIKIPPGEKPGNLGEIRLLKHQTIDPKAHRKETSKILYSV